MKIDRREFSGEADKQAMITLARACSSDNVHVVDLPYRLSSWALDSPDNIGLWVSQGQLLAWAVLQTPWWAIDYVFHPLAGQGLHRQVLDWADARARPVLYTSGGRPCWFVCVYGAPFATHGKYLKYCCSRGRKLVAHRERGGGSCCSRSSHSWSVSRFQSGSANS